MCHINKAMVKGFYINLDKRPDRKVHFEQLQTKHPFFAGLERFAACEHVNGAVGCGLSHIAVLKKCLQMEDDVFMICEDDLIITNETNLDNMIESFDVYGNWDIITLTPRSDANANQSLDNNFIRIENNQTTTGYVIKKHFISRLISNLEEAIGGLMSGGNPNIFSIDQYWKRLQKHYGFYYYKHIYAGQMVGYSDIEKKFVNYNDRFMKQ